jgi:poly(A) polymerase
MSECGVTKHFLAEAKDLPHLKLLLDNEKTHNAPQLAPTRFAALLPQDEAVAISVAARLKLSRREAEELALLVKIPALLSTMSLRHALYLYGSDLVRAAVFLRGQKISENLSIITAWNNPIFPIKGEDIVASGISAGPRIGEILRAVEQWWIAGDFKADRKACLAQIQINS